MSLNKRSDLLVLDLLNEANETELTLQQIEFDLLAVLTDDASGKNTQLNVSAIAGQGYRGNVDIKYNRIDLAELATLADPRVYIPPEGDIEDVVESLNQMYQLGLMVDIDIDSSLDMSEIGFAPTDTTVSAVASSLAYYGSLDIELLWEGTDLNSIIVNNALSGLEIE